MHADEVVKIIAGLGLGSGAGAIATAIISSSSQRGKSRAEAADLLVGAAERVGKMNESLDEEVRRLRADLDGFHMLTLNYLDGTIDRQEFMDAWKKMRANDSTN